MGNNVSGADALLRVQLEPASAPAERKAFSSPLVINQDGQCAWLHAPSDAATRSALPLLVVLHGAGKDKMWSAREAREAWAGHARAHGIAVLYIEARGSTWDYISSRHASRRDVDFLEAAVNGARRALSVDDRRIALLGLSDGGSMALSLATHSPGVFQAAISVSAGFCAAPPPRRAGGGPRVFMEHGAADKMFPLARVGIPLRDRLTAAGYEVEHRVEDFGDRHQGHVPASFPIFGEGFVPKWLAMG